LSFTLYELALQPRLQKRLRAEIAEIMNKTNGSPAYEDVNAMKYLNMVVSGTILSDTYYLLCEITAVAKADNNLRNIHTA
jgi:hypothetical protein